MRFNLRTMLYAVAVLAAGMAVFGLIGLAISAMVLCYWAARKDVRRQVSRFLRIWSLPVILLLALTDVAPPVPMRQAVECANNLRQVAIALHEYVDDYGQFPPPSIPDKNGIPMHSWRLLIQPYLERGDLFNAYNFGEPWNGPSNRQLTNIDLPLLRCPSTSEPAGETTVFAVLGPNVAWMAGRGRKLDEFADGPEQTLLLIEATGRGINWLEPRDLSFDEALALLTSDNVKQAAVVHANEHYLHYTEFSRYVAMADGGVVSLPIGCRKELAEGLLTIDGGERLELSREWRDLRASTATRLHWPRIWGIAVFVVLVILPWRFSRSLGIDLRKRATSTDAESA